MTIQAAASQVEYQGDGVSVEFAIPFVFDTSADLKVILTDADGVPAELSTGFSITGGAGSTGTCTMDVAPANDETLTILDDPELTQPADYTANDAFPADAHEAALDRLERQIKRLHQRVDRSMRMRDGDRSDGDDLLIPLEAARAGKFLAFDANGNPVGSDGTGGGDSALRTDLASPTVGNSLVAIQISPEETAAGATIINSTYAHGVIRRYGNAGEGNSSTDTAALVAALSTGHRVVIPKGSEAYKFDRVSIPSNTVIWCEPGVSVLMPDGGLVTNLPWMRMVDVSNVTIYGNGSTWDFETKPSADENRHCFDLRGASHIRLYNLRASKAGGDGFYVGAGVVNDYSEDVEIIGCSADNCRRQGMSIVSVKKLWVDRFRGTNITGTSPQAGIDIEPNVSTDELSGIRITNPYTEACSGAGIKAVINDLTAGYKLDIVITGHIDVESDNAFNPQFGTEMDGRFIYENGLSVRAQGNGISVRGWRSVSTKLLIKDCTVEDPNESNDTTNAYNGHAVSVFSTGSDAADDIGNVEIEGLIARDTRGSPQMKNGIYGRNLIGGGTSSNIRVIRPREITGFTDEAVGLRFTSGLVLDDPNHVTETAYTTDTGYSTSSQHALVTNEGAAGTVTVSLNSNCPVGDRVIFRVKAAQEFRIDPDGSSSILPGGSAGVYWSSNQIGAELEIERESSTEWYIKRKVGIWSLSTGTVDPTYTETNVTTDRAYDADTAVVAETNDVLGTLIKDLRGQGSLK